MDNDIVVMICGESIFHANIYSGWMADDLYLLVLYCPVL